MANARKHEADLSQEIIRSIFDFCPITGSLIWRAKDRSEFTSEQQFKRWNTSFAGKKAGSIGSTGYVRIRIGKAEYMAHRLIWLWVYGKMPAEEIDHVNGVKNDNRIENLRCVSGSENCRNRPIPKHNTSGVIGVAPARSKNKWIAHIMVRPGENVYLGTYASVELAAAARRGAERAIGYHVNHGRRSA
ncbi:hypothetical protein AGRHK599_LOCUS1229 [Rhizobium rhizogenes]|uniref:HNH nuclease domain-containing protein n=1 Tax=Rhizobium rhizogenes TaxID=359 RepID=A0AAN2A1J6_RHIRH|nr:HNH endonuclease signature motif containing protein [Rhizobium rhizogenes]MCZ7443002.1 HNH endonuclease signature motif containing protein [Rhizobium rhizogenes]NSZ78988.1 HNH endonuclease [Agrobacterium tumefaciens]CAD0211203.1 hypothetical protein AGRHK599_LOCUS1229 [Rhizobium rhizogenes]